MITCPSCGKQNRTEAQFCKHCGADLSPMRAIGAPTTSGASIAASDRPPQRAPDMLSGLAQRVKRWVGEEPLPSLQPDPSSSRPSRQSPAPASTRPLTAPERRAISQATAPTQPTSEVAAPTIDRLTPLQPGSILFDPQDPQRKYSIVMARELPRSIYYDALDLTCPGCNVPQPNIPPDGLCQGCHTPLQPVLIHERRPRSNGYLTEANVSQLIRLSAGHSSILPHQGIIRYQETVYTVVEHPGRWGVLVRGQRQRSPEEVLAGAAQIGQALAYLHNHDFAHAEVGGTSIEGLIVVGGERSIKLADLSTCTRLQSDVGEAVWAQIDSDIAFLAWLLFYLSTGKELSRAGIELAPPMLRPLIEQAMQRQYASVQDMLTDLLQLPATSSADRSLKPSHGQATHPGQKHARNEDAVVTFTFDKEQEGRSVPVGFYLVADGMGGHDAGDLASRTVNQIVTNWIIQTKVLPDLHKTTHKLSSQDITGEMLAQAIRKANEALVKHAQTTNSDLGSTVTAALVIGDIALIASVGDSRTYILRNGRLEQITQDHSLVARLVDAAVIKPEDVRSHPQRNQIYRCLGHKSDIDVDVFTRQLRAGDILVLCSDGLWEMILDEEIQRIVETTPSPQKACDALVEAANRAGGEDNIAVIVVEME